MIIFISSGILFWSFKKKERLYEYPFFNLLTFAIYLLPQAYDIVYNPTTIQNLTPEMIDRFLVMVCLCLLTAWIAYTRTIPRKITKNSAQNKLKNEKLTTENANLFFKIAIIYTYIGLFSFLLSIPLSGTNELSGGGRTGITTILFFFGQLQYIGLVLLFLTVEHIEKRKLSLIEKLAFILPIALNSIVFLSTFKRSYLINLFISISIPKFFVKRYVVPRKILIISVLIAFLLFSGPVVRTVRVANNIRGDWTKFYEADYSAIWEAVSNIDINENVNKTFESENKVNEVKNAILYMESVSTTESYTLGLGAWQTIINRFIPAQLLGDDFKNWISLSDTSLSSFEQFRDLCSSPLFRDVFKYNCVRGVVLTGFSTAYAEFWYFGCLFFALYAHIFKILWYKSVVENNIISQTIYVYLFTNIIPSVTHSVLNMIPSLIFSYLFIYLCLTKIKLKKSKLV
ncbi:MAG: hypothetical protein GW856_12890, partial [Cyanobacteria bacterium]|nr:hypothetical protein [Cyanobacteria bacterium CG_2015-16_32_12]NCQ02977.1 hypothetical protein [Cyanobacteria bacterium CG_2015-09_32_10]